MLTKIVTNLTRLAYSVLLYVGQIVTKTFVFKQNYVERFSFHIPMSYLPML